MMMLHPLSALTLVWPLVCSLAAALPAQKTGFLDRTVKFGALTIKYQVYVPPTYDGHQSLPVILFMHGSGERGSDGLKQTQVGMPSQIRWHRDWFNAIVVMPQCPDDSVFRGVVADATYAALEKSVKQFHGDRSRIYVTGLSMGGYGVWQEIVDHPDIGHGAWELAYADEELWKWLFAQRLVKPSR